jgi:5-methylcytosine-specific restriction protein A
MTTYLLTWNPSRWSWDTLAEDVAAVRSQQRPVVTRWSCGNTRSIRRGDRFYLLRQGRSRPGIIGSGVVTRPPFKDRRFDTLVDPTSEPYLSLAELRRNPSTSYHWRPQKSGTGVPPNLVAALDRLWRARTGDTVDREPSAELADGEYAAFEGRARRQFVLHRRREQRLRAAKVQRFLAEHAGRLYCEVPGCGFDFGRAYGALGDGYAQVHHLRPLARGAERRTSFADLAVVCANCHAMIHRGGVFRTIQDVATMMKKRGPQGDHRTHRRIAASRHVER